VAVNHSAAHNHLLTGLVLGGLIAVVGSVLGAVAGVALRALRLPKQRFGLCTGYVEPSSWSARQPHGMAQQPNQHDRRASRGEAADVR